MRRNLDITYVVMDNAIYGLTKGQTSPTSGAGFTTLSTPKGNPEQALNPLMLAIASGATFVARGFSAEPQKLADLIVAGIDHKGFSFIDVYSPCPTFNKVNTFKSYKESVAYLPAEHQPGDPIQALNYANSESPLYLGVFHRREAPSFGDHIAAQETGDESGRFKTVENLFNRFS
jgi:2-oxoglutarate ferredoxin oxidoreductase subunit beta